MTDRPILFSAPMIRALLDGRKTQTRRALTKLRRFGVIRQFGPSDTKGYDWHFRDREARWNDLRAPELLKHLSWEKGDRLWVRETICQSRSGFTMPSGEYHDDWTDEAVEYCADGAEPRTLHPGTYNSSWTVKRPAIHMPRRHSRLTLTVTDVRVQRLQEISYEDVLAEGCPVDPDYRDTSADGSCPHMVSIGIAQWQSPRAWYHRLWDEINGTGAWDINPWIVALTFTVERRNIDHG